jgi:hypothetical protein
MAGVPAGLPAGVRISDHISLGVIARAFPPERVQQILAETGKASERERDLPAQVMAEPLAKLRRGSARFVASGDSASAISRDCSGIAWYSAASERFWVTSGKPMAALPRNGGKALMSCLGANALR